MKRSEHRILTTHAGSLPRPAALTQLYARRLAGDAVDAAEIEAYPQYKATFQSRATAADKVSNRTHLPKAIEAHGRRAEGAQISEY